jgi:hypothetical protein
MALSDTTKLNLSYKRLSGKANTSNTKAIYEESRNSNVHFHTSEIMGEPFAITGNVTAVANQTMTADPTVGSSRTWLACTVPGNPASAIIPNWLGSQHGYANIRVYEDNGAGGLGNEIFPTDAVDWVFDYKGGILFLQNGIGTKVTPLHIVGSRYTGATLENSMIRKSDSTLTFYVNGATGSDVTGDGSAGNPWATIQHAIDQLPEHIEYDIIINVASGTYNEDLVVKKTSTSPELQTYLFIRGETTQLLAEQTADSGTYGSITDVGAFAGQNHAGKFVELLAGPNYLDLGTYYWWSNYYPIFSNTDDTLQLPYLSSAFSNATHYRIVENTTIIRGDGTLFAFGLSNFTPASLDTHVQNIHFTRQYFSVYNLGQVWIQGCSFAYDTVGYAAVMNYPGGKMNVDGCYCSGNWSNATVSCLYGQQVLCRWNVLVNGVSGIENDSTNYVYSYGNLINAMSAYGVKGVNGGTIKGAGNANYATRINNCAWAVYGYGGAKINIPFDSGTGNTMIARLFGDATIYFNSTRLLGTGTFQINDAGGLVIDQSTGFTYGKKIDTIRSVSGAVTLTEPETKSIIINSAATTIALPDAAAGLEYTFIVTHASYLRVNLAAGDTARYLAQESVAGGYFRSMTVGNVIKISAIDSTQWIVTSLDGAWTFDS